MAGDVATAGTAGAGVTQAAAGQQELTDPVAPAADGGVAPVSAARDQAALPGSPAAGEAASMPSDGAPAGSGSAGSAPAESEPVTSEPVTSEQVTSEQVTSEQVTSEQVTSDAPRRDAGTAGVRRRLSRLGAPRAGGINPVLEPLIKTVRTTHPKADVRLIERAYDMAAQLHGGQSRKSGDPYITHPLAVATILAELGMNHETLCAALLHDTIEDTAYTLAELRRDFGEDIAVLVDGVTKLDKVKYGDAAQAETVRKMVVAMSRDIRVLVIKLADRLHNMRTLRYLPRAKQEQKSHEVLEIFAPLAHRLGMNTVKWELEDLAFATLFPKRYDEIARLVSERAPRREVFLQEVVEDVSVDLREAKIKARVTGRPKHYYSVYQKMIARNVSFDDIYDLVGIRVLVDSVRDCYAVLGTVHARWNPVAGRFKDYIAMPKFNLYQSLHTTVIGPEGKPVELQIRTWGMHRRAEYGVAAHWKYKEELTTTGSRSAADMDWLRQLVDWQRETADPAEFLESLRFDLGGAEVYVFTPRGEVIALPQGATPIDFAYAIHTEVGHRTIGARVNGRLVALESALNNGDTVEIFTSKATDAAPSRDWLGFVQSARARNKIRHWFSKERRGGGGRDREVGDRQDHAQAGSAAAAAGDGRRAAHDRPGPALRGPVVALRLGRRGPRERSVRGGQADQVGGRHRGGAGRPRRDYAAEPRAQAAAGRGFRRRCGGRRRRLGPAVQVLHAGARRPDHWLRDPRQRGLRAPCRLREPAPPARVPARAAGHGPLVATRGIALPGGRPGRGTRPDRAAVRRDQVDLRPARQHPVGHGDHYQGPGGLQQVHLRDGRPQAPRARAARSSRH